MNPIDKNTPQNPGLPDLLALLKADTLKAINCIKPARVLSFDGEKKTVKAQILFKRQTPAGDVVSYPVVADCPVVTLQGGDYAVQLPIEAGDQCLLFCADRNIDAWFKQGTEQIPPDNRLHDISDGFALVGINYQGSSLESYPYRARMFKKNGASIEIEDQIVAIKNQTTTLLTLMNGLIDVIAASTLNVPGATLSPATIAALNAYKIQLAGLLE